MNIAGFSNKKGRYKCDQLVLDICVYIFTIKLFINNNIIGWFIFSGGSECNESNCGPA